MPTILYLATHNSIISNVNDKENFHMRALQLDDGAQVRTIVTCFENKMLKKQWSTFRVFTTWDI